MPIKANNNFSRNSMKPIKSYPLKIPKNSMTKVDPPLKVTTGPQPNSTAPIEGTKGNKIGMIKPIEIE